MRRRLPAIEIQRSNTVAWIAVTGNITLGSNSVPSAQEAARSCIASGAQVVMMDLGGVEKMDAAGVSEVVAAFSIARSAGTAFNLTNVPRRIKELLAITRLDTVIPSTDSEIEVDFRSDATGYYA